MKETHPGSTGRTRAQAHTVWKWFNEMQRKEKKKKYKDDDDDDDDDDTYHPS